MVRLFRLKGAKKDSLPISSSELPNSIFSRLELYAKASSSILLSVSGKLMLRMSVLFSNCAAGMAIVPSLTVSCPVFASNVEIVVSSKRRSKPVCILGHNCRTYSVEGVCNSIDAWFLTYR